MIKQKKLLEKLVIVVLIFCIFGAQKTFALKRAIFPDKKSLQPMPADVHPNISGNINSVSKVLPDNNVYNQNTLGEENNVSNETLNNANNQKNWMLYIIFGTVILLIILGLKKLKNKVNAELRK